MAAMAADAGDVSDVSDNDEDMESEYFEIPISNTDRVVQIPWDSFPKAEELINVFKAEETPLQKWFEAAVNYFEHERLDDFAYILEQGCSEEVGQHFEADRDGRVQMLNTYAAFLILSSGQSESREASLGNVVRLLNEADTIKKLPSTSVNKGVLQFVRQLGGAQEDDIDETSLHMHFDNARDMDETNLLATLGKGAVLFKLGKFAEAKASYKKAIREHPGCSADVRVSLGLCYYRLGQMPRATQCFERALEMDEDHLGALVALAVLELGRAQDKNFDVTLSKKAMSRIRRAYQLDKKNPMTLNHLANHFFFTKTSGDKYKQIEQLTRQAYQSPIADHKVKAESAYILGRTAHEKGDFGGAQGFYDRSINQWKDFKPAQFAVAQMLLYKSERELSGGAKSRAAGGGKASRAADKLRKAKVEAARKKLLAQLDSIRQDARFRRDKDVLHMTAWLSAKMNRRENALELYRQLAQDDPTDEKAWMEQARLLQLDKGAGKRQRRDALRAYTKAAGLMENISHLVFNNVGELKYQLGDAKGALVAFRNGLKENASGLAKHEEMTLQYNLARVLEDLGEFDEAELLYKGLVDELPAYADPVLRLGAMAERHGRFDEAESWYQKALAAKPGAKSAAKPGAKPGAAGDSADEGHIMLGRLAQRRGDLAGAKKHFEAVRKPAKQSVDAYSKLSVANLVFRKGTDMLRKGDARNGRPRIDFAKKWYSQLLQSYPDNIFAANGLACVLSTDGHAAEARKIWEKLREPDDAAHPSVWINLAHQHVEDGRFEAAAGLYQQCVKRFALDNDVELLLFLANAYVLCKKFDEAKSTLLRAVHLDPGNLDLRYNLSVLVVTQGAYVCEAHESRTLAKVVKAVGGFKFARTTQRWLSRCTPKARTQQEEAAAAREQEKAQAKAEEKDRKAKEKLARAKTYFLQEPRSPRGAPPQANFELGKLDWAASAKAKATADMEVDEEGGAGTGIAAAGAGAGGDGDKDKDEDEEEAELDALPCRRPLAERAPRDTAFVVNVRKARDRAGKAADMWLSSGRYIALEEERAKSQSAQLAKVQSSLAEREQAKTQRLEVEQKVRADEEAKRSEQAQELQTTTKTIVDDLMLTAANKKEKEKATKGGKKKGNGKNGAKGDFADNMSDDGNVSSSSSSSGSSSSSSGSDSDSDDNGNGNDNDNDKKRKRDKKKNLKKNAKKKKKKKGGLAPKAKGLIKKSKKIKKSGDASDSSDSSSSDDDDDQGEDQKMEKVSGDSAVVPAVVAPGGEADAAPGGEAAAAPGGEAAAAVVGTSEPPAKKQRKIVDSDDEDELAF